MVMKGSKKYLWRLVINDYPLYSVENCDSFKDFLMRINVQFGDSTAFRNWQDSWTYREFYSEVLKLLPSFPKNAHRLYAINSMSPYIFATLYFSIIISGNVAVLVDNIKDLQALNIQEKTYLIDDENIGDFYCEDKQLQLEEYKTNTQTVCTIACSSGTTSVVKGVMLSQENLLSDMIGGMRNYEYSKSSRYVNVIPYTHLFGIVADLLGPLYSGGEICFSDSQFDFFYNLRFFQPTNLNLPPALVNTIFSVLNSTRNFEFTTGGRLKKVMCAGASMNDDVNTLFEKYGMRVYAAYGLTECSPCVTLSRDYYYKVGSCGKVLDCCEIRIENDEILVRGKNVMLGYYSDPEATNLVLKNNWLYTGDLGYLDDDGFLFIYGRKTSLIVFENGNKIVPELLESKINQICGIKESFVFGRKEQSKTKLYIVLVVSGKVEERKLDDELRVFFSNKNLLEYISDFYFTKEPIPKNKLGKIIRNKIDDYIELFSCEK